MYILEFKKNKHDMTGNRCLSNKSLNTIKPSDQQFHASESGANLGIYFENKIASQIIYTDIQLQPCVLI